MALKGMAFAQGGRGGYVAGLYPSNPTLESRGILQFTIDVPFTWTNEQKLAAPIRAVPLIKLDDFKDNHEVMAFTVLFTGPWANPAPIPFECTFFKPDRQGGFAQIFKYTDVMPTPQSQGWEWWEWFGWRTWVGKVSHEMDRGGAYKVYAKLSGVYEEDLLQDVSKTMNVSITVENTGTVDHSFGVNGFANEQPLSEGVVVPIPVAQRKATSFSWLSSPGDYSIGGKVWDNGNLLDSKQIQVKL